MKCCISHCKGRFPVWPQLFPAARVTTGGVAFPTLARSSWPMKVNHRINGEANLTQPPTSSEQEGKTEEAPA